MSQTVIDVRLNEQQFELAAATIEMINAAAPHFTVDDAIDAIFIAGLRTITAEVQLAIEKSNLPIRA